MKVLNTINAVRARMGAVLLAAIIAMFASVARADTDVTNLVTDATTLWGAVKVFVLGVIGFGLLIAIVKWVRRK